MVRQQQEIRTEVGAGLHQRELGRDGQIARKQYATVRHADAQHQGGVIAAPAAALRRPQTLDAKAIQIQCRRTGPSFHDGHAALPGDGQHVREAGRVPTAERQPQPSHRQAAQDGGRTTPVVEIGVSQGEQVEALYSQGRQCRQDGVASPVAAGEGAPGIDQDCRTGALDQHRVALAHVQEHDPRR